MSISANGCSVAHTFCSFAAETSHPLPTPQLQTLWPSPHLLKPNDHTEDLGLQMIQGNQPGRAQAQSTTLRGKGTIPDTGTAVAAAWGPDSTDGKALRREDGHPRCLSLQGMSCLPHQNACPGVLEQCHPLCREKHKVDLTEQLGKIKSFKGRATINMFHACVLSSQAAQLRALGKWHGLFGIFCSYSRHSHWCCSRYQEQERR